MLTSQIFNSNFGILSGFNNRILAGQLTRSREMNLGLRKDNMTQTRFSWLFDMYD